MVILKKRIKQEVSSVDRKIYGVRYKENNPIKYMLRNAEARALKKDIKFSLKPEDIFIPETCPYLGVTLTNLYGSGRHQTNVSLDRINSSGGYTKDNVQVISSLANIMKNSATEKQLIAFAKGILRVHAGIDFDKIPPSEG